jgi:hypothetical protein
VPADLLPEVLLAFAYVLVPGSGLCLAARLTIGRSFFTFLALSFGLGYTGVSLVASVLVLLGIFRPLTFGVAWCVLSAVAWSVAIRGRSLGTQVRGWVRLALADPWTTAGVSLALIGVTVARVMIDPLVNLAPTVLRYWADGLQIADAGGIPRGTLQWGTILEPTASKVILDAFNAGASFFVGRDPLSTGGPLLIVVALGLVIVTIGLLTELGVRRLAAAGALLLFVNRVTPFDLTTDLDANVAENWGRLVALSALLAAALAFRIMPTEAGSGSTSASDPGPKHTAPIAAGIVLGAAAGTHLVATAFGLATLFAFALAYLAFEGSVRQVAARTGTIVGVTLILGGTILVSAPGDIGFEGAVEPGEYRALRAQLDLPPTFDPTRFIATHDVQAALTEHPLSTGDVAEQFAYKLLGRSALRVRQGEETSPWLLVGPTVVALALAVTVLLVGPRSLRIVCLAAVLLGSVIFVVGVLFAFRYDLFVLEFFGNRRLFSYAAIPLVLVVTAAGETALAWLGRHGFGAPGASMVGCAVVLILVVALIPGSVRTQDQQAAEVALLRWVGRTVPCEGRLLSDHRTLGTFQTITGHAAVLEGMGPHVRPSVLTLAIEEVFLARRFFRDPGAGLPYLRKRGVAAIVVGARSSGFAFGGYSIARVPPQRLDRVPYLRRAFENEAGIVYLVDGYRPDPRLPSVAGRPGFRCPPGAASARSASAWSTRSTSPAVW